MTSSRIIVTDDDGVEYAVKCGTGWIEAIDERDSQTLTVTIAVDPDPARPFQRRLVTVAVPAIGTAVVNAWNAWDDNTMVSWRVHTHRRAGVPGDLPFISLDPARETVDVFVSLTAADSDPADHG